MQEATVAKAQAGLKSTMRKLNRNLAQRGLSPVMIVILFGLFCFFCVFLWSKFQRGRWYVHAHVTDVGTVDSYNWKIFLEKRCSKFWRVKLVVGECSRLCTQMKWKNDKACKCNEVARSCWIAEFFLSDYTTQTSWGSKLCIIMYNYYIVMKFMFLVVKSFFHPFNVYASFSFSYYELNINNIKIIQNQKLEACHNFIQSSFAFVQNQNLYKWRCFSNHKHSFLY